MPGSDRRSTGEKEIADSHQIELIHQKIGPSEIDLNRPSLVITTGLDVSNITTWATQCVMYMIYPSNRYRSSVKCNIVNSWNIILHSYSILLSFNCRVKIQIWSHHNKYRSPQFL